MCAAANCVLVCLSLCSCHLLGGWISDSDDTSIEVPLERLPQAYCLLLAACCLLLATSCLLPPACRLLSVVDRQPAICCHAAATRLGFALSDEDLHDHQGAVTEEAASGGASGSGASTPGPGTAAAFDGASGGASDQKQLVSPRRAVPLAARAVAADESCPVPAKDLIQGVVSEVCGAADVQGNSEKLDALSVQMRESEAKMKSMDDKIDAILVAVAELGRGANFVEEVSEVEDTSPPGDEAGGA